MSQITRSPDAVSQVKPLRETFAKLIKLEESHILGYDTLYSVESLQMFWRKRRLTFNGLHGVISQKIGLFITIAVRTLNPT
jgi:hypothetical protein